MIIVETPKRTLDVEIERLREVFHTEVHRDTIAFVVGALTALKWVRDGEMTPYELLARND